jgi:hypothetical protein
VDGVDLRLMVSCDTLLFTVYDFIFFFLSIFVLFWFCCGVRFCSHLVAPALRAVALMKYARSLLVTGNNSPATSNRHFGASGAKPMKKNSAASRDHDENDAYVREFLWTSDARRFNGGAIKYDLDWVANNYNALGCDLWEEIQCAFFLVALFFFLPFFLTFLIFFFDL